MYLLADSPRKTISPGATDIISRIAKIEKLSFDHYVGKILLLRAGLLQITRWMGINTSTHRMLLPARQFLENICSEGDL